MTAPPPRPLIRQWTHQGVVEAAGFLVEHSLLGSEAGDGRNRALELWEPGTRVFRLPDAWLVLLPPGSRRRIRADRAPGLPLVPGRAPAGPVLLGLPLDASRLAALSPPAGSVVRARGGGLRVEDPVTWERVDPAEWLDADEIGILLTSSLGFPPVAPRLCEPEGPPFDPRKELDGVPPESPELAQVLAALGAGEAPAGSERGKRPAEALLDRISAVGRGLRWALGGRRLAGGAGGASLLRDLAERIAVASRLSLLLGRRHAAYIQRMIEMFERGDVHEALRHAIPLGRAEALRSLSLRPFSPRSELTISPDRRRAGRSLSTSHNLFGELERIYRDAFDRLAAQERIGEAAFLLSEVLHADEEAVTFLERHGRLRLAAEMAEARSLPPGLVVRQWFLAGDRERALAIARRTGAFADAVTRLERQGNEEEARSLRLLWGGGLAEAGDYAAAVDAVWPVAEARRLAQEWMDRAIGQGGVAAARMLARKLVLLPGRFAEVRDRAVGLLESWRAEDATARLAFATALTQGPPTPEARTLARAAVRAVARDSGRLGARLESGDFRRLVDFAGDGALRVDAPALRLAPKEPWTSRGEPWRVLLEPADVGTMPAADAAFLANGLTAVALGEAGVRLLTRANRAVGELDQPAHRLVLSDRGDRAVALARRGDAWRLARLDFAARRAESWCDARMTAFAADFDGALWMVAAANGLVAVEVPHAMGFDGPWGVPELRRGVAGIARSPWSCAVLLEDGEELEVWRYELPGFTLRGRGAPGFTPPPLRSAEERHLGVTPRGRLLALSTHPGERPLLRVEGSSRPELELPVPDADRHSAAWSPGEPLGAGGWIAAPVHGPEGIHVFLVEAVEGAVRAEVVLGRARQATLRLAPPVFIASDDRGRVLVLDLEHGLIRRSLRL